jgi:D-alanyl-D-alanine dipeptidase
VTVAAKGPVLAAALAIVAVFGVGCGGRHDDAPASSPTAVTTPNAPTISLPTVPPVSPQAAAVGFVDVKSIVPEAIIDLRYATPNNFVKAPLYPADARCLVHESMADGLASAAAALRPTGEVLVFWDCYRPHDVQVRMFDIVPNPNWVARPGDYSRNHEAGRSVDVTLASRRLECPPNRRVGGLCAVDMGTDFDDFTPRGRADATDGVSAEAQANRARLRAAMAVGGLSGYDGEWWHFNGPDADVHRPIINIPVN